MSRRNRRGSKNPVKRERYEQKQNRRSQNTMRGKPKRLQPVAESIPVEIPKVRERLIPRTPNQRAVVKSINNNSLTFVEGEAGTGKTLISVGVAVDMLDRGRIDKITISRPSLEAHERIGFLPGTADEKLGPFVRPILDAFLKFVDSKTLGEWLKTGVVEIAPMGFLRGRNLEGFILLDEAQNITFEQAHLFLTRMCENAIMVLTYDRYQSDLPKHLQGAVVNYAEELGNEKDIGVCKLDRSDIQRHELVKTIVAASERIRNRGTN
jgi:phosphate starvation-inducible PhoH-like protein